MTLHSITELSLSIEPGVERTRVSLRRNGALVMELEHACDCSAIRGLSSDLLRILYRGWQHHGGNGQDDRDLTVAARALTTACLPRELTAALAGEAGGNLLIDVPREWLFVPWETLWIDGVPLTRRFGLGRRARELAHLSASRDHDCGTSRAKSMHIWSNAQFDLMVAEEEASAVQNVVTRQASAKELDFQATVTHTNYTRQELLQLLHSVDWFHFAGHARRIGRQRGWTVVDGELTARDLPDEPGSFPRFVFAHACGSAHIDPAATGPSLVEAFVSRGVRHFLGLWTPLLDQFAATFATSFYRQLLRGHSIGQALLTSRLQMAGEFRWSELMLANYVLYGDPAARLVEMPSPPGDAPGNAPGDSADIPASSGSDQRENRGEVSALLDVKRLQYPVRCRSCGREFKSRFLIDRATKDNGQITVLCRYCTTESTAKPVAPRPPLAEDGPKDHAMSASVPPDVAAAWLRLLASFQRARPVLDSESGNRCEANWTRQDNDQDCLLDLPAGSVRGPLHLAALGRYRLTAGTSEFPGWTLSVELLVPRDPTPQAIDADQLASWLAWRRNRTLSEKSLPTAVFSRRDLSHPITNSEQSPPPLRYTVLASASGWTEDAIRSARTPARELPADPREVLVLVDLQAPKPYFRPDDVRTQSIVPFLDWEDDQQRLRRILDFVAGLRPLATSVAASRVAGDMSVPVGAVIIAFRNLVYSDRRLRLDEVSPFGWVLSERDSLTDLE